MFLVSFAIFYPSLFTFFTNDDFFFLKISNVNSIQGFLNFFNIFKNPDGFGMYRPLTTQVFYFLSVKIFSLSAIPLHIISLLFFFGVIYLVYKLISELSSKNVAYIATFLYAVSATHFGHLYYLATFQELGMTFFVLLSCLAFLRKKNYLSFIFFLLALMSKETAVVTPFLLTLIYLYKSKKYNFKKLFVILIPFIICLLVYLFIRFRWYGIANGDSYIWDFSIKKLFNTSLWYLVWSFNIPESFVDFVGPGIKINSNLFIYWGSQVRPILLFFAAQLVILAGVLVKALKIQNDNEKKRSFVTLLFCFLWFGVSLLPVIFLPIHKFTFFLTIPLIAVVFRIAYLFENTKINRIITIGFIVLWTVTSILTLKFSVETSWITQGSLISKRVFYYFLENKNKLVNEKINFTDTSADLSLPWSPTSVLRTALSDKNFFYVFFPEIVGNVSYINGKGVTIESRHFLGY